MSQFPRHDYQPFQLKKMQVENKSYTIRTFYCISKERLITSFIIIIIYIKNWANKLEKLPSKTPPY